MAVIERDDNTPFIIQAYREPLRWMKRGALAKQLQRLATEYGRYVYLRPLRAKSDVEAVFANEPGYLLAETLWQRVGQPSDLIFCEPWSEDQADYSNTEQCLLVVIRQGTVILDRILPQDQLYEELLPLQVDGVAYHIMRHTEIHLSIASVDNDNETALPSRMVGEEEVLEEILFPELPVLPEFQLQPLSIVLNQRHLKPRFWPWVLTVSVCLAVIVGWKWLHRSPPQINRPTLLAHPQWPHADPYLAYHRALASPAPRTVILALVHQMEPFYLLPGWQLSAITLESHHIQWQLTPAGGDLQWLLDWADQHQVAVDLSHNQVNLTSSLRLALRSHPIAFYPAQRVAALLVRRLTRLLGMNAVQINTQRTHQGACEITVSLTLTATAPMQLALVAQQLQGLPVVLTSAQLHVHAGLLDGKIDLSVWGS